MAEQYTPAVRNIDGEDKGHILAMCSLFHQADNVRLEHREAKKSVCACVSISASGICQTVYRFMYKLRHVLCPFKCSTMWVYGLPYVHLVFLYTFYIHFFFYISVLDLSK